jgi:hypothetical protein
MKHFSYLIKKIINRKQDNSSSIYFEINKEPLLKTIFNILVTSEYSIKKKFEFYQKINSNIFLSSDVKNKFNTLFCHIQKTFHLLNRLVFLYKYKKTQIIVDTDMCLNKINIDEKNIICIFQNNGKYLFHILDLIKMFTNSLTNSDSFFATPIALKNPYNNLPFTKSNLYNIYFFIKFKTYFYSELYFKYFLTNFDLTSFYLNYEYILREYAIENYIKNTSIGLLHLDTLSMIRNFNRNTRHNKIVIDHEFPKEKLVKIMKPYLLLYIKSLYSLVKMNKEQAYFMMHVKLIEFSKFNPNFGRKIIHIEHESFLKKKIEEKKYCFNDKHILFNKKEDNFLNTHSKVDYANTGEQQLRQLNLNYNEIIYDISEINQFNNNNTSRYDTDDDEINDNISNIHHASYNNNNNQNNTTNTTNRIVTNTSTREAPIFPSIPIVDESTFISLTIPTSIYRVNPVNYLFLDEDEEEEKEDDSSIS